MPGPGADAPKTLCRSLNGCLMRVPVDMEDDLKEIFELEDILQWQSTLLWLKKGDQYHRESLDIMAEIDEIAKGV
jgi:hypothetical protein